MKRTTREESTNKLICSSDVSNPDIYIAKVPRARRKDGMILSLESSTTDSKVEQIEICWLNKPEFLYCLSYTNLMNHTGICIEEGSVCYITIERNPLDEKRNILVCPDFFEKRYKTYAKNVTLMPKIPLIAEILMIIFTREVTFQEENGRYSGFEAGTARFKFTHSFTGKDVEDINQIRSEISESLFNNLGISGTQRLSIFEKVKKLLFTNRLLRVEDSRNDQSYCPPAQFIKIISLSSIINQDHYLAPLQPLSIPEDERLWSEEGQAQLQAELINRRSDREKIVIDLQTRAKLMTMSNAELVCKECGNTICSWNNVSPVQTTPVDGVFIIRGIYATVIHDSSQTDSELELPVVQFVRMNRMKIDKWARCTENHIIGWQIENNTYICHLSSLQLALPSIHMDKISWSAAVISIQLWRNGIEEINKTCNQARKTRESMKFDLYCPICDETLSDPRSFRTHIQASKQHLENSTEFIRNAS